MKTVFGQGLDQQGGEEAAGDWQADTLGLSGVGKGGEAVAVEEEGRVALPLESGEAAAELSVLVTELLEWLGGIVSLEGLQEALGIAVDGLAGEALPVSSLSDVTERTVENSSGIGDAELGGKLSMGVTFCRRRE